MATLSFGVKEEQVTQRKGEKEGNVLRECVLSHVLLFATPWTVCSLPDSSVRGILQTRTLLDCHALL